MQNLPPIFNPNLFAFNTMRPKGPYKTVTSGLSAA